MRLLNTRIVSGTPIKTNTDRLAARSEKAALRAVRES